MASNEDIRAALLQQQPGGGGGGGGGGADTAAIQAQNAALQQQVALQKQKESLQPQMPDVKSLLGDDGMLQSQYQMKWDGDINPDMRGMNAVRDKALATGPSSWAQAALQKQGLEEQGLKNQTEAQGASAEAQARSGMASKFGLSPAAQARLATQQMRAQMSGMQNVGFQGAKARADIGLQDENTKNQFLSQLPGQENALAQIGLQNRQGKMGVDSSNISGAIAQKSATDKAAMDKYHEQMSAYSANQNAEAMRAQGGGGK